jgi:hypothetical protein
MLPFIFTHLPLPWPVSSTLRRPGNSSQKTYEKTSSQRETRLLADKYLFVSAQDVALFLLLASGQLDLSAHVSLYALTSTHLRLIPARNRKNSIICPQCILYANYCLLCDFALNLPLAAFFCRFWEETVV